MNNCDRIFIDVWNRLTHDWSRLTTFRQMGVLGEAAAREAIHLENSHFFVELLHGKHQNLLKDRDYFLREGFAEGMQEKMTEDAVSNFRQTLHASTLVFAHSILDAAIFDCVRICAEAAPSEWSKFLGSKKVALADVAAKSHDELLQEAIRNEVNRLERESLPAKCERVFQICRPTKNEYLTNGFRFDLDRLRALDDLRHKVVHAPGATWTLDGIYDDLQFMQNSGLHVFVVVGERFQLCFSGREAMEALAEKQK